VYELIRMLGWNRLAIEQLPPFFASFVLAELFYKFHSFVLECAAFLLTWFLLDALWRVVGPHRGRAPNR
jgi:hypothetical protein